MAQDKGRLTPREAFFDDRPARAAYAALMRTVFDRDIETSVQHGTTCRPFAIFDGADCVACAEVFSLQLAVEGNRQDMTALRAVGVAPPWRGHGLFRDLMVRILAWHDATAAKPLLLYAEAPDLYLKFGFHPVRQHRFVGRPPAQIVAPPARQISLERDRPLIDHLLATRTLVSRHVAIDGGAALFLERVTENEDFALYHLAEADALVVIEDDRTLIDVVAAKPPSLATILAALALRPARVDVLFPPDRLAWSGKPVMEDAGLMARGTLPAAFDRPFMLPPTAEF